MRFSHKRDHRCPSQGTPGALSPQGPLPPAACPSPHARGVAPDGSAHARGGGAGGRWCSGPCRDSPEASPGLSPRDPRRGRSPRAVWWRWRRGGAAGGRGSAAIGLRAAGGLSVVRRGWPRQPLAQPSAGMLPLGGCGALRVLIKAPRLPPV